MKDYLYRNVLEIVQEKRIARGSKFLYLPRQLSFADLCRAFYYEHVDPQKSDEVFISSILKELAEWGLLSKVAMTHYKYRLNTITFHDVYVRTTDGGLFCRGTSADYAEACAKAIGEVFERTSLKYNYDDGVSVHSLKELNSMNTHYLSPHDFAQPTTLQKDTFPSLVFEDNDRLSWVTACNVRTQTETLVPAQNVFYNNFIQYPNEKVVLLQSTHGAGGGYTRYNAIRSGVCEIVHRHFFLADWYAEATPPKIATGSIPNTNISKVITELEVAGFTVHLLDYSKKAGLPTVVCVLERYGGWSMGASTSATMLGTIERAVSEATATYLWQAQTTADGGNRVTKEMIDSVRHDFTDSKNADAYNRVMLYSSSYFVESLAFCRVILSGPETLYTNIFDVADDFDFAAYAVKTFGDAYIYETKKAILAAYSYHAVRVIIPKSYPFALNEIYCRPVLNGKEPGNAQLTPFP